MIDEETRCHELLYYMSEKDASGLAEQAFAIFYRRHYPNLLTACRLSIGALTKGRPLGGASVDEAANDLAALVMTDVYEHLCTKFVRAPRPGTERYTVQAWLSQIAKNYARREWVRAAREYGLRRRVSADGMVQERDDQTVDNADEALATVIMNPELVEEQRNNDVDSRKRAVLLEAFRHLSDGDQEILRRSVEFGAGWSLSGHASHANSRRLAELFQSTPVAIRQRRKRALDRLRAEVRRIENMESSNDEQATAKLGSVTKSDSNRRSP